MHWHLPALFLCATRSVAANGQTGPASRDELVVRPGEIIDAVIEGQPARLRVGSGRLDRLTLDPDYVAARGIKPAPIMGSAEMSVAGRREFKGKNRPLTFSIAGRERKGRAFWFAGAPVEGADGRIGPFGLPQPRTTFILRAADPGEDTMGAPLLGDISGSGYFGFGLGGGGMAVSIDVEDDGAYPVASAAAGALIARTLGGQLSGASWDVEILMGVKRPVRLLTLAKPLVIGALSFDKIAVRVRDRIDAGGRGNEIADADAPTDPAEIVVQAKAKGPQPFYGLTIPRAGLAPCSRVTFDVAAKRITFLCRVPAIG